MSEGLTAKQLYDISSAAPVSGSDDDIIATFWRENKQNMKQAAKRGLDQFLVREWAERSRKRDVIERHLRESGFLVTFVRGVTYPDRGTYFISWGVRE
jgi:hypothetical protein